MACAIKKLKSLKILGNSFLLIASIFFLHILGNYTKASKSFNPDSNIFNGFWLNSFPWTSFYKLSHLDHDLFCGDHVGGC